jgi:hypothetical protein
MTAPVIPRRQEQVAVKRGTALREQSAPIANTDTTLYTVPKGRRSTGILYVAERGGASATYRVAVRKSGAALANAHYIAYGRTLDANTTHRYELELDVDDVVTIRASTADTTFGLYGSEDPRT